MRRLPLLALFACTLASAPALAYNLEIQFEAVGQGYQVSAANGALLTRRRLDNYLGLHLWNLGPKDANGLPTPQNQLYFTMSLRFSTDIGDWTRSMYGGRDVSPELGNNRIELLYAYLGVDDLGGLADLKLGRQLIIDPFEFVNFDGLSVELKTPYYLAASVYGGLLVNGALPIDSPIFRPDGVALGSLSVHDTDYKPLVGVNLRSFGFRDLDARFTYRRVFSPAQHTTADERAASATDGTSEEKIGYSIRGRLFDGRLIPWFGLRYNLVAGVMDIIQGGARVILSDRHSLQLEYVYSYPTFDGDSIWNLFVRRQFDDLRLGYDLRVGRLRAYARALARLYHDENETVDRVSAGNPKPDPGALLDRLNWGGNLGARVEVPRGFVRLDGYLEMGYGGTRAGVDLASRLRIWRDLIALEGRLTYAHFYDDLRARSSGDSFGVQLGARMALWRGMLLHVLFEDNINNFYNSQLRFYAILDLAFLLGSQGFGAASPQGIGPGLGSFGNPYGTGMGY